MNTPSVFIEKAQPAATSVRASAKPIDPIKSVAFTLFWIYLFLLGSRATEFIDNQTNLHLILLVGILAGFASLLSKGIFQVFTTRSGLWLSIFTGWLILTLPFSSWRGGSFHGLVDVWLKSYATFILAGSLIFTFSQFRRIAWCMVLATVLIVTLSIFFGVHDESDSRLLVAQNLGTLANSNDLASQLLIDLPFLLFFAADRKTSIALRGLTLLGCFPLLYVVLRTGSRAGLLAIGAMALLYFFHLKITGKLVLAGLLVGALLALPWFLPEDLRDRYSTILANKQAVSNRVVASAIESSETRQRLLIQAGELILRHPILGVGLDQFAQVAADVSVSRGEYALWHPVHNFLLLVAAENGIPGVIFYCSSLLTALLIVRRVLVASKKYKQLREVTDMAFYLRLSLVAFVACGLFSTNAYTFQLPLLIGLAEAFDRLAGPIISNASSEESLREMSNGRFSSNLPSRVTEQQRLAPIVATSHRA